MNRTKLVVVLSVLLVLGGGVGVFVINTGGGFASPHPQATLTYTYHRADDSLTIRHSGGDIFHPSSAVPIRLELYVYTGSRPADPRTTIDLPFGNGDGITVTNVTSDDRVLLVWVRDDDAFVVGNYSAQYGERSSQSLAHNRARTA